MHQCEIGTKRGLQQVCFPVHVDLLLAFLNERADAGRRQHAAETQPPARMRSTKVPCGIRSIVICLPSICCCAFGLSPIWVPIMCDTCCPSNSLPTPFPGVAA